MAQGASVRQYISAESSEMSGRIVMLLWEREVIDGSGPGGFAFDKLLCLFRLAHKVMTRLGYSEQQIQVRH